MAVAIWPHLNNATGERREERRVETHRDSQKYENSFYFDPRNTHFGTVNSMIESHYKTLFLFVSQFLPP